MTREDAIIELKEDIALYMPKEWVEEIDRDTPDGRLITALEMAIKALEQTTCEDCVSRPALLEEIENGIKAGNYEEGYEKYAHINDMDDIIECIKYADSVYPKQNPKAGHWFVDERPESNREVICSNCEQPVFKYHKIDFDYRPKYCPNCGAKMGSEEGKTW